MLNLFIDFPHLTHQKPKHYDLEINCSFGLFTRPWISLFLNIEYRSSHSQIIQPSNELETILFTKVSQSSKHSEHYLIPW